MSAVQASGSTDSIRMLAARVRLSCEIFLWRHGVIWAASVAMLLAALAVLSLQIVPSRADLASAESQYDAATRAVIAAGHSARLSPGDRVNAPLTLGTVLPSIAETDARVRRLYSLATRHALTFQQSTFQTSDDSLIGISRVQLTLPVTATYPELRQFIEALLRELPYVTVDQLVFKRHNIGENRIEAELHVSCWFRTAAYPASTLTREGATS